MKKHMRLVTLAVSAAFACGGALADKPDFAGGGKQGKPDKEYKEKGGKQGKPDREYREKGDKRDDHRGGSVELRFGDDSRRALADYFGMQARSGNCPPGLAKKRNGCLPPGQAKKWAKGRPLPGDLRFNDLPRDLLMRLPPPPPNHRYVQVAGDVLMIAVGSMLVVDAVEDLFR